MASIINATTTNGVAVQGDNSGSLQLQTNNGTTAVTIDTSQRVGVGTTSPQRKVSIVGTDGASGQTEGNSRTSLFLDNNGANYLSIFTSTSGDGGVFFSDNGSNNGGMVYETSSDALYFKANNAERMRIASDGTLQVKSSTTTAPWDATSGNYVWVGGTYPFGGANSDIIAIFNRHTNNGTVVEIKKGTSLLGTISHNGTNTAYNTSSDYRLKENIAPMQNALNLVQQLKPCTYTWKANNSNGQGFIAHELQECLPDAVTGEKDAVDADGKIIPQQIDTSFLVATLTAAIQELKAELDATKAEVAALKGVA